MRSSGERLISFIRCRHASFGNGYGGCSHGAGFGAEQQQTRADDQEKQRGHGELRSHRMASRPRETTQNLTMPRDFSLCNESRGEDSIFEIRARFFERKACALTRAAQSVPGFGASNAGINVSAERCRGQLVELPIQRVHHDLVELLAIHETPCPASPQGPSIILVFGERLLQALEGISHSTLRRILWHSNDLGDVLERDISHFSQQKNLTLFRR